MDQSGHKERRAASPARDAHDKNLYERRNPVPLLERERDRRSRVRRVDPSKHEAKASAIAGMEFLYCLGGLSLVREGYAVKFSQQPIRKPWRCDSPKPRSNEAVSGLQNRPDVRNERDFTPVFWSGET